MVDRHAEFLRLVKRLRALGATTVADGALSCSFANPTAPTASRTEKATPPRISPAAAGARQSTQPPKAPDPDEQRRLQYARELGVEA